MIGLSGTLESSGANGGKIPSGYCRDLGFTSITDNASTTPSTSSKASNPGRIPAPLVNAVDTSADTKMEPFPEGTVEGGGING